jgi:hypothetical protein
MMDYYYHSKLTLLDYLLPILALPVHNFLHDLRSPKECMRIRLGLLRLVVLGIVG